MKSSADEQTSEKNVNGGIASDSSCVLVPAEPSEVQHDAEGGENEESKVAPNSVLKSGETADLDHSNHVNEKGQTSEGKISNFVSYFPCFHFEVGMFCKHVTVALKKH